MSGESPWIYVVLMSLFILEAWALSRLIPFHRNQNIVELGRNRVVPLDGLRGILAVSVFFIHVVEFYKLQIYHDMLDPSTNFYAQLGVMPVTVFFFITGYVFWLKLRKQEPIPLGNFLYARLGRLGPAYWFACIPCFILVAFQSDFHRGESWPKLLLQGASWFTFFGSGHDINNLRLSAHLLGQAWTLRFEWLFYASLPFLGWFASRRYRLLVLIAGCAAISYVLLQFPFPLPHHIERPLIHELIGPYFGFIAFTFSVGMAAATIPYPASFKTWAASPMATFVSAIFVFVTLFLATPRYGWQESLMLAFPFMCVCLGNTWFGILSSEPVRFLGRISYSFYLIHVLLLSAELFIASHFIALDKLSPLEFWAIGAISGFIAIPAAALSYQLLEFPFLHVGKPARQPARQTSLHQSVAS